MATKIYKNIWIGDGSDLFNLNFRKNSKIRCILNVAWDLKDPSLGVNDQYLKVNFHDGESFPDEEIRKALDFLIENFDKNILVCCAAGMSRSVIILSSFLYEMDICQSLDEAIEMIRKKRPWINPDFNSLRSVRKYYEDVVNGKANSTN